MENQTIFHVSAGAEMQDSALQFDVGEHVRVLGRIQSREYVKKLSETETETRVAYEVSVSKLECIEES